ncbi:MAG: hypothetical protein KDK37_06810 [Leptospiraceae bacterium]|nr:hypothetical protein [Leptospiraceae bacterium]MCB1303968.1 hypothetical protein [Leptospiraceae bacterium]
MEAPKEAHFGVFAANLTVSALGWFLLAIGVLVNSQSLGIHFYNGPAIALVHTFTLLTITPAILGVLFQLLPVVVEGRLSSRRLAWFVSILWWIGAAGFVASRWFFPEGIIGFIPVLLLSIVLLLVLVLQTVQSGHWNAQAWEVLVALGWLVMMSVSGMVMAGGVVSPLEFVTWHAWTGILGWFALMIVALTTRLLPMFLLSHGGSHRWAHFSATLLAVSPIIHLLHWFGPFATGSLYSDLPFMLCCGLAGLAFLIYLQQCVRKRMRRSLETPIILFLLAFLFPVIAWALAAAMQTLSLLDLSGFKLEGHRIASILVVLMLPGFVGTATVGMGAKIVPFMSWMAMQARLGPGNTILPRDLGHPALSRAQLFIYPAAVLLLACGCIWPILFPLAGAFFFISATLNAVQMGRGFLAIRRTR